MSNSAPLLSASTKLSQTLAALSAEKTLLEAARRHNRTHRIDQQFADAGEFRRELYAKHLEFFAAGADNTERCFMAANRVGKTRAGACEMAYHLTGLYPHWWEGRRFPRPGDYWAAGSTTQTTRDIVQAELLGKLAPPTDNEVTGLGTGMVPRELIVQIRRRSGGVADAIELAHIKHVSGGLSTLGFKTYDQGRKSFEGTGKHGIWVDEECPEDVYLECLTRCMTTNGIIWLTFTPLQGMTPVVLRFLPPATL